MFGLGGYWLGIRRQQSLPLNVLTTPQPSRVPTATPFEQLSVTPTITISQTGPTAGWKTYTNTDLGISITYPSNVYLYREGYEDTEQPRQVWSISWGNMEYGKVKGAADPNTTGIKLEDLYALGYYSFFVSVDNNPVYQAPIQQLKSRYQKKTLLCF
jgi:hypothetical protein